MYILQFKVASAKVLTHQHDLLTLQNKLTLLETENTNLKQENIQQSLKHIEIITYNKQRHDAEIADLENNHKSVIILTEKRYEDMVQGLKKIHLDELNSIQERYKYSNNLEQMSNSIKNTSGSIRLIEEQLNARYKGAVYYYILWLLYMYICMYVRHTYIRVICV